MEEELAAVSKLIEAVVEFSVAYGFQILGALVVLGIGLKAAGWAAARFPILRRPRIWTQPSRSFRAV